VFAERAHPYTQGLFAARPALGAPRGARLATIRGNYARTVERVRAVESERVPGTSELAEAVAFFLHKLMAYKDEYEVARLYTDSDFLRRVADQFEGPYELHFHLAPPLTAQRDPQTGHLEKRTYGPRMLTALPIYGMSRLAWSARMLKPSLRARATSMGSAIMACTVPAVSAA